MPGAGFIGAATVRHNRRAANAGAVSITAAVVPASSPLVAGQTLADTVNWQVFSDPANYTATAPGAAIADVAISFTGDTAAADAAFADGEINSFSVTVTDTQGTARIFVVVPRVVVHAPPITVGALAAQSLSGNSGLRTYDVSDRFSGPDLTFTTAAPPGVSIDGASGVITFDTGVLTPQTGTLVTVTAANSGGGVTAGFELEVRAPVAYAAQITGTVLNPTFGATAQIGTPLTGLLLNETGTETVLHRWRTDSGVIAGATAPVYTPAPGQDLESLRYAPLVGGQEVLSDAYTIRHAPPEAGVPADLTGTEGGGPFDIGLAQIFTGADLTYTSNRPWAVVSGGTLTVADAVRADAVTLTAANSGGVAQAVLTVAIDAPGPVSITAAVGPATSPLVVGQTLGDTTGWAAFLALSNYTTDAPGQSISGVTVNYTGDTPDAVTPLADGDTNAFSITVTDTGGTTRTFPATAQTVAYAPPLSTGTLADLSFTQGTGTQSVDAATAFTGGGLVFSVNALDGAGIDSATGLLSFDTDVMAVQAGTSVVVTAANSGGSAQSGFSLGITEAVAAPAVSASAVRAGRRLTVTVDGLTGTPPPAATLTLLTLDGVDVSGDAAGSGPWEYDVPSSGISQTVAWTVTAANTQGSDMASGSVTVPADLTVPAPMAAPAVSVDSPAQITVTLAGTPDDGGSAITRYDIRYRANGGSWTVVNGVSDPVVLNAFNEQDTINVQNRAGNAVGTGDWSASRGVTTPLAAPVSAGALADQVVTTGTGLQTYDASGDFTGSGLTFSVNGIPGVAVDAGTGIVSFDTDAMVVQAGTSVVLTASNAGGSTNSGFSLTVTVAQTGPVNTVTIAAGKVNEDLAGFPVKIDLADLSTALWDGLRPDGGNLRATNAADNVTYPLDVTWIDPVARTGTAFVKRDLTAATATGFVLRARSAGTTAAASDAADGRNAVWADYLSVLAFPDLIDRTGNGTVATPAIAGVTRGGPQPDALEQEVVSSAITANQGIAWDGTHWLAFSTNAIRKYDTDWNLVATNNNPIGDTGISGVNHMGDGTVIGGELFVPVETYPNSPYDNQHICVFDPSDLSFKRSYDISAQAHETSGIGYNPANSLLYIPDFTDSSTIYTYNTVGAYQGAVSIAAPFSTSSTMQGIEFFEGHMYVTGGLGTDRSIYRFNADGTFTSAAAIIFENTSGTNYEGMTVKDGALYALRDGPSDLIIKLTKNSDMAVFNQSWFEVSGLTNQNVWTFSSTVEASFLPNGANGGIGSIRSSRSSGDRASAVARSANQWGAWNNSDSWMVPGSPETITVRSPRRVALAHNGTTERKLLLNGAAYATDTGITAKPATGANMVLNVGAGQYSGAEPLYGTQKWVFLHREYRSDNWLLAEYESLEDTENFYTLEASGGSGAGPVALSAPRISDGFDTDTFTVDTTGFSNVTAYDWRILGGATLSTNSTLTDTQIDTGSAEGQQIECEITHDGGTAVSLPVMVYASGMMGMTMPAGHITDDRAVVALVPHSEVTHYAVQDGNWTSAATWNTGAVPGDGAFVLIPHGRSVTYDSSSAGIRLDRVRIDGTLTWATDQSTTMLVENMVTTRSGSRIIGSGPTDRLPAQYQANITISAVDWSANGNDTPTDIKASNFLATRGWGRGILNQGLSRMWGAEKTTWGFATAGVAQGATSLTLNKDPVGLAVGDEIYIGATTHEYTTIPDFGTLGTQDEYRTITGISGRTISWATGLTYPHNNQLAVSTFDFPPVVMVRGNKNITIRSEVTSPAYRRGHTVSMHHWAEVDEWDVNFLNLGRTDKSFGAGVIDENGDFKYNDSPAGEENIRETLTPQSNLISRYPSHLHHLGFNHMGAVPIVAECYMEGTPGWGYVHHNCDARFERNAGHLFYGAGMVSEQGNEVNNWNDNLMAGTTNDKPRDLGSSPKNAESGMGVYGDNFRHGEGFGMRGRAMRTNRNVAQSCGYGHVFFPRGYDEVTFQPTPTIQNTQRPRRDTIDISLQGLWAQSGNPNTFPVEAYPILHFADNMAIACVSGGFITKGQPQQNHDVNVKLKRFKAYGCRTGWALEYVGVYILDQFHCIAGINNDAISAGISMGANTTQVMAVNARVEGFYRGIENFGNQGINTDNHDNVDNPRYGNIAIDAVNCVTDIYFENDTTYPGTVTKTTEEQTAIRPDLDGTLITYDQDPVVSFPLEIADQSTMNENTPVPDNTLGKKSDNFSSNGDILERVNGDRLLRGPSQMDTWLWEKGHSQYNGGNKAVLPIIFSDRLTGRPKRQTHLVAASGPKGPNNGALTYTATPVTRGDIFDTVARGSSITLDVVTGASGGNGTFSLVGDEYIAPDHGVVDFDVAAGEITYTPDAGDYNGPDEFYVFVESAGQYATVRIALLIGTGGSVTDPVAGTHFTASDAAEANTARVELFAQPGAGGRNIRTVFYSTDAGGSWRRLCHNWCTGVHKITTESDGTALTNGAYNVRLRYRHDHEYAFSGASGGSAVTVS